MIFTTEHDMRSQLGDDLWTLFARLGSDITQVENLTSLSSDSIDRGSYKVTLADSRIYKGRRFSTSYQANTACALSKLLNPSHFPKIHHARGKGAIIDWIEGAPLRPSDSDLKTIRKAAAIQAQLAATPLPNKHRSAAQSRADHWIHLLKRGVAFLMERRLIKGIEAGRILDMARIDPSDSLPIGLIHGDFCTENVIVTPDDKLIVIDLETLSVSAIAYDLARTAYRWPMNGRQRGAYLHTYGGLGRTEAFLTNFSFWIPLVLCNSAVFRAQNGMRRVEHPLTMLRDALNTKDQDDLLKSYGF